MTFGFRRRSKFSRTHRNLNASPTPPPPSGIAVGLGFCLAAQVPPLLAVASAVAEDLLLAGEVLRRAVDLFGAVPGRRLHCEIGIDEVRARERNEIGAP